MLKNIGATEWIIIAFVLVLLLGSKKIPEFLKSISDAFLEFKKASKENDKKEEKKG
jgi:TatA/E family protein of Tat protein translocase